MPDYAIYGVHFYGTAQYGAAPTYEFALPSFTASPSGYTGVRLQWGHPSGTYTTIRLVRGTFGFPTDHIDGTVLLEVAAGSDPGTYLDTPVETLRFYYYSLFLQVAADEWVRAGDQPILMPQDYGYSSRLYELVPGVFSDDGGIVSHEGEGRLEVFLSLFGDQLNIIRSELESLLWVHDAERMAGGLLPYLADQLGFPYEAELGMELMRQQIINAVYLYKTKGTQPGIEGAASVLSGWAPIVTAPAPDEVNVVLVADRINHVQNPSFEDGSTPLDLWAAYGDSTAPTFASDGVEAQSGSQSASLTAVSGTGAFMGIRTDAGNRMIVPAGITMTGSAYWKPDSTVREVLVGLSWYDRDDNPIGSTVYGDPVAEVAAQWTRVSFTAQVPVGEPKNATFSTDVDGTPLLTGAPGTFLDTDAGLTISDSAGKVPAGTVILAYIDSTQVIISKPGVPGAWDFTLHTRKVEARIETQVQTDDASDITVGEIHYVDAVMLEKGSLAEYFDASTGLPISDNLWEPAGSGTPHLSPSHYYHRRAIINSRLVTRLPDFIPAGYTLQVQYAQPL